MTPVLLHPKNPLGGRRATSGEGNSDYGGNKAVDSYSSQFDGLAFSLSPSPPHPVIDRCDVEFCVDSDFFVGIKKKIARGFSPPAI